MSRHPDDGNLAALDRYMARMDEAEIRQQAVDKLTQDILRFDWDAVMDEIGQDVADCLAKVYWGDSKEVQSVCCTIHDAAERVAERMIDAKW